jgi:signal transduction histidine kinase
MEHVPSVLVIDDEPNGFAVIEALLHRDQYQLSYTTSGQEALNSLETIKPDLILLDVMMPDMDGIEVCQRIKSDPSWKHIPIIMVTALSAKEDLAHCLNVGADDFLAKPVNGVELRARVRSLLRIKQQYDALKATIQLREDLSNMIVHDLRNPIASILLSSHLLIAQHAPQGKELERIQVIQAAAQKLSSMANDLLMLAKMEANKLMLNLTDLDLSAFIPIVITNFEDAANAKELCIRTELPEGGRWISADVNLLHRLLDNLLSNAIKFSSVGGTITVRVEYSVNPAAFKQARIQVIDEGPGIEENLKQRIFNRYEIGELFSDATQIGLGLTFCKMVAEAHGGHIFVKDNQPQGAIFTVEI